MSRYIDADALKYHYSWWKDDKQKLFDSIVDSRPTIGAIPIEFIVRWATTCGVDTQMAVVDLIAAWDIDGATWKPKFNAVRMKGQKHETD